MRAFPEISPCFPPLQVLVFTSHVQPEKQVHRLSVASRVLPSHLDRTRGAVVLSRSGWMHSGRPRGHRPTAPCSTRGRGGDPEPAIGARWREGSIHYTRRNARKRNAAQDKAQHRLPHASIRGSASSKTGQDRPRVVGEDLLSRVGERSRSLSEPISLWSRGHLVLSRWWACQSTPWALSWLRGLPW